MAKTIGKPVRVRASRLDKEDCNVFCLSYAFRDVLLDLAERLEWSATWVDDEGERVELSDEQKQIIESGLESLTMPCEIIVNNNVTVEPPAVTVNVSGSGAGGCCTPYTVPVGPDGESFPIIPVNPNDPLDENVPTWDEVNQIPPEGYDDWQSFIDDRCRAANWFVDSYLDMVANADLIERQLSAGAAIMDIVLVIIAALPGPVGDWAGVVAIVKWVTAVAKLLTEAVEELEDLNDWLQFGADEVAANRDTLVCAAYSMSSVEWLSEFFRSFFIGEVTPEMAAAGASSAIQDAAESIFGQLFDSLAAKVSNAFSSQNIPADYVATTSCIDCSLVVSGFTFVPMQIDSFFAFDGHGSYTERDYTIAADGLSAEFTGDGANPVGDLLCEFNLVPPPTGTTRYVGVAVNIQGQNLSNAIISNTGNSSMWDGGTNVVAQGKTHAVRGPYNVDYPNQIPGVSTILKFEGVNVDACDPSLFLSLRFGGRIKTDGQPVKVIIKDLYWIQDNDAVC